MTNASDMMTTTASLEVAQ